MSVFQSGPRRGCFVIDIVLEIGRWRAGSTRSNSLSIRIWPSSSLSSAPWRIETSYRCLRTTGNVHLIRGRSRAGAALGQAGPVRWPTRSWRAPKPFVREAGGLEQPGRSSPFDKLLLGRSPCRQLAKRRARRCRPCGRGGRRRRSGWVGLSTSQMSADFDFCGVDVRYSAN